MNFNFGEVLTKAWKITWKYKVLWLFGMLASCGQGGSNSSNVRNSYDSGSNRIPPEMAYQITNAADQMVRWFGENKWAIFALVALLLVLMAIQIFVNTVGAAGLVRGAYHADAGVEKLGFGSLFRESLGYFWRQFGLGLVIWLPFFIIFFGVLFGMFFLALQGRDPSAMGIGMILLIVGLCCCLFPFMILLGLFSSQASLALLTENLGVFASIERGWNVLTKNFGVLFLMWLILAGIGFVIGLVVAIPVLIVVFPLLFSFMEGGIQSWQPFIIAGVVLLLYSPIHWFLRGVLMTFTQSAWTLTYLRLTVKPEEPVIVLPEANA